MNDPAAEAHSPSSARQDQAVYNHAPPDYRCPFCRNLATGEADLPLEFIHRAELVSVKINPRWRPRNPGAVLVIPNEHYENVYDLPPELGAPLQHAVRSSALAMKRAFGCDGISTRQHNEPAGSQDVWHHHIHVFPRRQNDDLDGSEGVLADAGELRRRADMLRAAWPAF